MSVTDQQFRELLRGKSGGEVVLLAEIEFAYETAAGPGTGTIYLSDGKYRTKEGESPSRTRYRDVIAAAPTFARAINLEKLGGRWTMSQGSLKLDNPDGSMDWLLRAIIDGREVRFYAGRGGDNPWPRADFRLVNVGTVVSVTSDETAISIALRDKNYLLDRSVIGDAIVSGPNAGKPKPVIAGSVYNVDLTPYLLDATALTYSIGTDPVTYPTLLSSISVYDVGISLRTDSFITSINSGTLTANAGTDTLSYAAHGLTANDVIVFQTVGSPALVLPTPLVVDTQYWVIASGLTANDFKLSLTRGGAAIDLTGTTVANSGEASRRRYYVDATVPHVQMSSMPAGRLTADLVDWWQSSSESNRPHGAFRYRIERFAPDLGVTDWSSVTTLYDAQLTNGRRYGAAVLDRRNLLELLDEIAFGTLSWYGWTSTGALQAGKLDLANLDAATALASISADEMFDDLKVENLAIRWGKIELDIKANSAVQTDGLGDSVTPEWRATVGQRFRLRVNSTDPGGTSYLANWWDYHASAFDSSPQQAPAIQTNTTPQAQTLVDEMTALFKPWTCAYRCAVGLEWYGLNPGDCVTLTYPRFGLDAGRKVRVMAVTPRFSDGLCDLVLVAQVTPDYTTASHA